MIVVLGVLLFAVMVGGEGGDLLRVRDEDDVVSGWMFDVFLFRGSLGMWGPGASDGAGSHG